MTLNHLYNAYLGELYGISFFTTFVEQYSDHSHNNKLQALLEIEIITTKKLKAALLPLVIESPDYDMDMDMDMTQKGISDANKWLHLPWPTLIDTMVTWVAPYQQRYQQQADNAQQHHALFTLVADHENTIYDFLLAEQAGSPESIHILMQFINKNS
ncbi:hypothetical protein C9J22_00970 [Photobacterium phosphoreum]|uniref:hypothetical protein n=1 Tax=Photobacterium phosphoreum TaxID=659 RepID=UPI000D16E128|nr:hypothetical protein [Photobacterium phosphoreum]PSU72560.1 hypothetical protein C9J22_00970 [Photobacterium phosphoreum]